MDIQEIRIANLRAYVKANGGAAKIARINPDIDPSYISQILTKKRSFGEKAARKMEERLKLPTNHFDVVRAEKESKGFNMPPIEVVFRTVPLFDFDQAVHFSEKTKILTPFDYIGTDAPVKKTTFALKIQDDIMRPIFEPGSIAIVDPELTANANDFVFAKNGDEATLKKLVKDGPDWYLKPLNPQYPTKDASNFEVIGVVTQVQSVTKFR